MKRSDEMMRLNNVRMKTTVKKAELLEKLKKNRTAHAQIVREARDGYVEKAAAALRKRLDDLRKGKIVALSFSLRPPLDYTETYDTTIHMLEMNQAESVVLEADEFRQLVEDRWDWTGDFIGQNKMYSATAQKMSGDDEED